MLERLLGISLREFLIGILTFMIAFSAVWISRTVRLSSSQSVLFDSESHLYLENDVQLSGLIEHLEDLGIEVDQEEMSWASRLLGWRTYQRGHYLLGGHYSYDELLSKLALGSQDPVNVTILPGITLERFMGSVSSQLQFDSLEIASVFEDTLFLEQEGLSREQLFGRMLPDTYDLYWTVTTEAVISRVLSEFQQRVVEPYKEEIDSQGYTTDELLTMASIVEWEAMYEDEKAIISGLYWNRLDRNMRLQADPTVNFALGERRRLLFEDYTYEHPYNTYVNSGLPPGPITNPSLGTILATLRPEQHDYLYMVANPEGGHVFSRTFAEHQVESEKWRRWLREQYRIKRAREQAESGSR